MFIRLFSPLPSHSTDCAFSTHVLCDFTENKLIFIENCKKKNLLIKACNPSEYALTGTLGVFV